MGVYLAEGDNAKLVLGIIGSGNRNFKVQYVQSAKRTAKEFDAPFCADTVCRGTPSDAKKITTVLTRVSQLATH